MRGVLICISRLLFLSSAISALFAGCPLGRCGSIGFAEAVLAFDSARREAREDTTLEDEREDDQRDRDDHGRSHDLPPRDFEAAARLRYEIEDCQRHGAMLG